MPVYVKDGGAWRTIDRLYVRDGTSFTNQTINNAYVKDGGVWRTTFVIFETPTSFTTGSSESIAVPATANAIHIKQAVGGGGGGYTGTSYDKAGGESSGPGGGSGAHISDRVYTVVGGETLTLVVGTGGSKGTGAYSGSAGAGSLTSLSGTITGSLFSLAGGGASSVSGGSVQGQLRTNTAGTGGTATAGTSLSSGTTVDGINITSFSSGPTSTFNDSGNGVTGGDSGLVNTPSTAGTQGGGGACGGAENYNSGTAGSAGGAGELIYRFMRIA